MIFGKKTKTLHHPKWKTNQTESSQSSSEGKKKRMGVGVSP